MHCTRKEMIERVKDCGQDLINKAESIVGNFEYGTDLTITCYIGWKDGYTPSINVDSSFIPESHIERLSRMTEEDLKNMHV